MRFKTFESFMGGEPGLFHGRHPSTNYYYIVLLDNKHNILGFATSGYQTEQMEKHNIYAVGTIWGPGHGDELYKSFIKIFGPIIPSSNESDAAKKSWKRKFDNPSYIKTTIKGIGYYDRYPEEEWLNTIFDIKDKNIEVGEIDSLDDKSDIYAKVDRLHRKTSNDLLKNKNIYYTIGQSRDRDDYITALRKNPEKAPYMIKESISETLTLYHGTSPYSADIFIKNGWTPSSGYVGGNQGQKMYLYLSSNSEDARWFSNEIGYNTVVEIKDIPIEYLIPDPEDEDGFTMEDLLSRMEKSKIPSKFALKRSLSAEHFRIL